MSNTDVVRASVEAYRRQDQAVADRLLAPDFRFTSPQDDGIDKATYLRVCFPTADRFVRQDVLDVVAAGPDTVFLRYEYELADGSRYRNTEHITVRDGLIVSTEVFFGGRVE